LEVFLRLSFHQDYRRDSNINVTATATTQQALVFDEATRRRLIELRQKILAGNEHMLQNSANETQVILPGKEITNDNSAAGTDSH
jgi:hypothetical protein